jgi:hypothetical protein
MEVGLVEPARQLYRQGVTLASRKLGADHVAVVEPLLALAQSFPKEVMLSHLGIVTRTEKLPTPETTAIAEPMNPRYLSGEGERALLRALKVLESSPDRSVQTYIGALVQTGDWFLFKQTPARAMPYYEQAARAISEATGPDAANVRSLLSFPVQVYYPIPSLATRNLNRPPNEVVERFVQLEFTVHEDGSISAERVADQDATDRQISQALDAIRAARYRPKFVDGKPVVTTAVSFRQIYRQRGGSKETE